MIRWQVNDEVEQNEIFERKFFAFFLPPGKNLFQSRYAVHIIQNELNE